ncbi:hypothetical protein [Azospirillum palustre]
MERRSIMTSVIIQVGRCGAALMCRLSTGRQAGLSIVV